MNSLLDRIAATVHGPAMIPCPKCRLVRMSPFARLCAWCNECQRWEEEDAEENESLAE